MATSASVPVCCEGVASVSRGGERATCVLANRTTVRLPLSLVNYVVTGDEMVFPVPMGETSGPEILVNKSSTSLLAPTLYLSSVGHVSQPRIDKRGQSFVAAEVTGSGLGVSTVHLPCAAVSDYFYRPPAAGNATKNPGLYGLLGVAPTVAPAEMRVAFKLRRLELQSAGSPRSEVVALERAFNLLAQPDLRACYDALLLDPEAAAVFPYGGFGSLLVSGERSRDGATFFARCILAFLPDHRQRRFHLALRRCDFYQERALCRDPARRLEFWIDPAVVPLVWNAGWNRWKHLLGLKMEVEGTFVQSGNYRKQNNEWHLVRWETGLPSRLLARLPTDAAEQVERAHSRYQRFGQYSRALDQVRLLLEHRAVEIAELERICAGLNIPGDFDIAQISWRPDYDEFFYRQLSRRARRVYMFRGEYIFEVEKAVVAETPQLGHATYVFAKPRNMESFLHLYTNVSKDDIRRNQQNVGERLGFLKRVIHGRNPRAWLKELRQHLGERLDLVSAIGE
jgi:hypothetical protein